MATSSTNYKGFLILIPENNGAGAWIEIQVLKTGRTIANFDTRGASDAILNKMKRNIDSGQFTGMS